MIDLDANCTRRGEVTCVRATVHNARSTPQLVELESTLDGPVWAPRGDPLAVAEWSGTSWVGVVPPSQTRGVGFATSAEPADAPVAIVSVERATTDATARDRALGELEPASPPTEVIER